MRKMNQVIERRLSLSEQSLKDLKDYIFQKISKKDIKKKEKQLNKAIFEGFPLKEDKENLEELRLFRKGLTVISKEIGAFRNLKILMLDGNMIEDLSNISLLPNLRIFYAAGNKIRKIPKEMNDLENLEELYLEVNKIKRIENISKLKKLRILSFSRNKIAEIPEKDINQCTSLELIDLRDNDIPLKKAFDLEKRNNKYKIKTVEEDVISNRQLNKKLENGTKKESVKILLTLPEHKEDYAYLSIDDYYKHSPLKKK